MTNLALSAGDFDKLSHEPTTWVNFKLPNFMYGLSHLYLDNCYQEVSSAVTVNVSYFQIENRYDSY